MNASARHAQRIPANRIVESTNKRVIWPK